MIKAFTAAVFTALVLTACSGGDEKTNVSEAIDRQTTRAAERIEKKIRTPLDRARGAKNLGDRRLEEMDRALQKGE